MLQVSPGKAGKDLSQQKGPRLAPIIFTLHKVRSGRGWDHTNIEPQRLFRICESVISKGYRFDTLTHCILLGQKNTIAITLDDGYAHLADVLPVLRERYGIRPTLFIPAGLIGKSNRWDYSSLFAIEDHLSAATIRELADGGCDIGSHGWSHRALTSLSDDQVRSELVDSRKRLEDITGRMVESISYPFGRTNPTVNEISSELGYGYGVTTMWPSLTQSRLKMGRIMLYSFDTPSSVLRKLGGRFEWVERCKQYAATSLASGTGVYQRLLRRG